MADLLTMLLVACDTRRNPAAKLVARQASAAGRAVSDLMKLACSGAAAIGSSVAKELTRKGESPHHHHKGRRQDKKKTHPAQKCHHKQKKYQSARKYAHIGGFGRSGSRLIEHHGL